MTRRPLTEDQKQAYAAQRTQQLEQLQAQIADKVTTLTRSDQWQAWLRIASRFHQYSFNNTLLIWSQRPDATTVAGYTTWQKLGRQVTKGEHAIRIMAPVTRRLPKTKPDGSPVLDDAGKPVTTVQIVGVKPASVFDISQTTGDPLPEPPRPQLLTGQAPDGLWDALASQVTARGYQLQRGDCAGANGFTNYTTHTVRIRDDVDDAQAVKTLAHELGHILLHEPSIDTSTSQALCRGQREVEAESVAHLVTATHGLDSSQYTFTYLASWAEEALPQQPAGASVSDVIAQTGSRVLKAAHLILDATSLQTAADAVTGQLAAAVARDIAADRSLREAAAIGSRPTPVMPAASPTNRLTPAR